MKITRVEKMDGFHKVSIEHNGMCAKYFLENSFNNGFLDELKRFRETFWSNEELDWSSVVEDSEEYVITFFSECRILYNPKVQDILHILQKRVENKGVE